MRLKDRVAIVTGAARGIGQAYSLALLARAPKSSPQISCLARKPSPKSRRRG
jgi:NADP-dependent 3-hydroxy acid dehydrogenase YdfG